LKGLWPLRECSPTQKSAHSPHEREADDNQGTFPVQSERFYEALNGQDATGRLVWLPLEAHGYEAKESLEHMQWEQSRWLDTHVKSTTPTTSTQTGGQ
jgi:hypothetical protein